MILYNEYTIKNGQEFMVLVREEIDKDKGSKNFKHDLPFF